MKLQNLLVLTVFSIIKLIFALQGCPNLILDNKRFPRFKEPTILNIAMYKPVSVSIKSPFYMEDWIQFDNNEQLFNTNFKLMPYHEKNSHQTMLMSQRCSLLVSEYQLNFIKYRQHPTTNQLYLVYDSEEGDVFCNSKYQMAEIYLIDYAINETKTEKSMI